MTLLQNAAMRKALGAVKETSGRKANAIAAVEDVETFAKSATGRFLSPTLCEPHELELEWWMMGSLGKVDCRSEGPAGAVVWM